jgi:hypothetical protein
MKEVINELLYDTNKADLILTDNGSKVIYGSFDTSSVQHYKIDLYITPNKRFFKIHQKGYEKYTNFFCTKTAINWEPSYLYPLTVTEAYNQFIHLITPKIKEQYFNEIQEA